MEEQHALFLKAIYAVQDSVGRADAVSIAQRLGMDVIDNRDDRNLYQETTLQLRDDGYLRCLANNYGLACGIVQLTPAGQEIAES
jgi:hypothetical protein